MSPQPKDITLLRYSFILKSDGTLLTKVDNIDPQEFLKIANELNADWQEAPVIARAIEYLTTQLAALDIEFDKHLLTL